jgi:diguanylate cyclase (GGDEF)-like protein
MVVAIGAPLGWLLIQFMRGVSPVSDIAAQPELYGYMLAGTAISFGFFGYLLGEREDRLERSNLDLEHLSVTDGLTGLRNARYFHARLDEENAERHRTGAPLSIVIIDLDHFKRINDVHGHLVGDDVLATAARAIASVTRQGETEARVGGEEFGLLLPGSDSDAAYDAAERVRRAIAAAVTPLPEGGTVRVTASAGVATTSLLPDATPRELYRAADEALYAAKAAGRNRIVVARAA